MSARKLHVSAALALPQDVVTSTLIVYGGKGMGKTNFGSVLVEECAAAGLRFAVIDPMGVWWGLRHSEDGKGPGIEVLILGGIHGDIPIEPTGGAVVADLVVDEDANVVVDISRRPDGTMWAIAERVRFVRDYCKRLYQRQGEKRRPLLQVIDEAARFIPQVLRKDDSDVAACMGAIAVLVEEGRNVGIGVALITQRSARLNKDVAELADCMIAFRTVGPNSRRAVLDWLGEHVEKDRIKTFDEQLRAMPRGSAIVVSPGWLEYEGVVPMRMRQTFDSSATPKSGQQRRASGPGAKPDLAKYRARMAETIEKAKADDPRELKKRIVELERELSHKRAAPATAPAADDTELRQAFRQADADRQRLTRQAYDLSQALERLMKVLVEINAQDFFGAAGEAVDKEKLQKAIDSAAAQAVKLVEESLAARRKALEKWRREGEKALDEVRRLLKRDVQVSVTVRHNKPFTVTPRPTPSRPTMAVEGEGGSLPKGERLVVTAVAQYPEGVERDQLTVLTGYKRSTRDAYVQRLRERGLVEDVGGRITATADALAALGPDFEPLPTGSALWEYWRARLPEGERRILEVLVAAYPEPVDRAALEDGAGYKRSTRDTYLQRLGARRLIELVGRGAVKASALLFD